MKCTRVGIRAFCVAIQRVAGPVESDFSNAPEKASRNLRRLCRYCSRIRFVAYSTLWEVKLSARTEAHSEHSSNYLLAAPELEHYDTKCRASSVSNNRFFSQGAVPANRSND